MIEEERIKEEEKVASPPKTKSQRARVPRRKKERKFPIKEWEKEKRKERKFPIKEWEKEKRKKRFWV